MSPQRKRKALGGLALYVFCFIPNRNLNQKSFGKRGSFVDMKVFQIMNS
jgi:hypothetical protein